MNAIPWLSVLIFVPWLGALVVAIARPQWSKALSLVVSLTTLAISLWFFSPFGSDHTAVDAYVGATTNFSKTFHVERLDWIPSLGVSYVLWQSPLSAVLVLLTGLIAPACLLASWNVEKNGRAFRALFLLLQGAALGVFLAQDFFLWFLFWELSLVPAYFLIRIWGGPDATRAAYQFVVYTVGGSAFMLLAFAAIYAANGSATFGEMNAADIATKLAAMGKIAGVPAATLIFLGVFLGVAVKVPLFPFHTWLPSAYAEAPVGVSMFLTAIMSKMGVYGFLAILAPLFPAELHAAAPVLTWLALAGVVFGAFAAMAQKDLKRMLGYSSINHLSYCLLALFAIAAADPSGARVAAETFPGIVLQMFNHGLSAAALFFFVGVLESRSGGKRGLNDFGGVRTAAPVFAGLCGLAMFSSLGLPGLNGFVGEFIIFRGVFALSPWVASIATLALLATAIFLLTFYQRVFHGPPGAVVASGGFRDLSAREIMVVAPAIALMFVLGVYPQLLLGVINRWVVSLP